jgi:hypothetical protein
MNDDDKVRENRVRRMAERQGLQLQRCKRRDPNALGYGTYRLADPVTGTVTAQSGPSGYGLTLADVEKKLTEN